MDNANYFYCYSIRLFDYLSNCGFSFYRKGLNPKTNKNYWMFYKTPELMTRVTEFTTEKKLHQSLMSYS